MRNHRRKLLFGQRGQGMVEYILIVALIALLAIVGIRLFGSKLSDLFKGQATKIEDIVK